MRKSTIACLAVILLSVAPAHAQYTTQQQAHAAAKRRSGGKTTPSRRPSGSCSDPRASPP